MNKLEKRYLDPRTEGEKALRAIQVWLIIFALLFAFYVGAALSFGTVFLREVRAYNTCASVEDHEFTACYNKNK